MPIQDSRIFISLCFYGMLIAAFLTFNSTFYPLYNWDIVPYVSSVLNMDLTDINSIHVKTYQILRDSIPDASFNRLLIGPYPEAVYSSPDVLHEQLNFYFIKPLYISLIYAISHLGISIVDAIALVSLTTTLFSAILVLYWISRYTNSHISFITTLLVGFQSRLFDLGRIATPDALSVCILLLALFLLFERKYLKTAGILFAISILIRSNNIIFTTLFLSYITFFSYYRQDRSTTKFFGGLLLVTLATYFSVTSLLHGYNWWTLFYHSFVNKLNHPSQFDIPFSMVIYLNVITHQLQALLIPGPSSPSTILIFIFLLIVASLINFKGLKSLYKKPYLAISIMILINYGAHVILFPGVHQWDRFFTSFYVFSSILLIAKLKNQDSFKL